MKMSDYFKTEQAKAKKVGIRWPTNAQLEEAGKAVTLGTKRGRLGTMKHLSAAFMLAGGATMRQIEMVTGDTHYDAVRALTGAGYSPVAVPAVEGHKVYKFALSGKPARRKPATKRTPRKRK